MYEEGNERTVNGVRKANKGCTSTCPFYCGLPHTVSRPVDSTTTKESHCQGSETIEVKQIKDRLHYDPRTQKAIETIENAAANGKGLLQQWKEIEQLINTPLRR